MIGTLHIVAAAAAVAASPTPAPAEQASTQTLPSLSGFVYYDSRYDDTIANFTMRHDFASEARVVPYAALMVDYDTRSIAAEEQIYNDDAVVANLGLSALLDRHGYASLFAAGGYSFGLRTERSYPETRFGFSYERSYGSAWESDASHAEIGASLTAYSRYAGNVLEESSASIDARLSNRLRAIAGGAFNFDAHRDYGNNYAEVFGGLLWPLSPNAGLQMTGAYGRYLSRGVDVPANPYYTTLRIELHI